jgi:copper(I)-binding protein
MPKSIHSLRGAILGAVATLALAGSVLAGDIKINDAYARSSGAKAKSGAIFMEIMNTGTNDDQLVGVRTTAAKKAELHTHIEDDNGIMKMREVEGGFAIPAGGMHMLARGGDHVMLMGLTGSMVQGDTVELTLEFEQAGEITVTVPVDLERKPMKHKLKANN